MSGTNRENPLFKFLSPDGSTHHNKQENHLKTPKFISGGKHVEETYHMLEKAVEQSIDGIAVADLNGVIRFCNRAWAKMHGYQIYELLGKHLSIFHTQEQMERDVVPFNEQVKNKGAYHGEVGHVKQNGKTFLTWMTTTLLKNEKGKPVGLIGIARNITRHKQIQKALISSEERYRKLFENSIEGIGISKGNRVITANKALLDIFGYDNEDEFTKIPLLYHVALESRDLIRERMRKRQKGEWVESRFEYKIIHKDGTIRDIEAASSEIVIDNERYVLTTFHDITEQKKIHRQLQACLKEWQVAFNSSKELLLLLDKQFIILRANEACAQFIGKPLNLIIGKKCYEVFHGTNTPPDDCLLKKAINTKKHEEQEIFLSDRDIWLQVTVDPILDEKGNVIEAVYVTRDITGIKKTAQGISRINDCFVGFGADPGKNINSLVSLCGEVMGATCALYSRLEKEMLCSIALWQVPADFNPLNKADGLICYDVIKRGGKDFFIVRDLDKTHYAQTDPYVLKYGLKTYIGLPINFENNTIGSLCVVYQKDFLPSEEDKRFMQIIASAIAVEENRRISEEELKKSEEKYRFFFEENPAVIMVVGIDGKIRDINRFALENLGYSRNEVIGKDAIEFVVSEQKNKALEDLKNAFDKGNFSEAELSVYAKNGSVHNLWFSAAKGLSYKDGKIDGVLFNGMDITETNKIKKVLRDSEKFLLDVFESIQDGISILNTDLTIRRVNNVMEKWYANSSPLVGKKCFECYHGYKQPCSPCPTLRAIKTGKTEVEVVPGFPGSSVEWVEVFSYPIKEENTGKVVGVVEFVRDVTMRLKNGKNTEILNKEVAKSNRRLRQLVLRDSHTGLYNHRYLQDAIEAEFSRAERYAQPLSVIMLDIDYFKSINDVYSHQFGDLVLKQFARQLKRMVRRYDTVIRFGGEEFIVISPGVDKQTTLNLAHRILDKVNSFNFGYEKQIVRLKLSIAVASYPQDSISKGMDLVGLADRILNKAKEDGGNRVYSSLEIIENKKNVLAISREGQGVRFLKGKIEKLHRRANQSLVESVFAFARTLKLKDQYTGEHVENTVHYATEVARRLSLSKEEIEHVRRASMLHDLGKIGISEKILRKKGKLTLKEFSDIKKHPQIGADILRPIHFLHDIIPLVHYHHERWDGRGYPRGLKKAEIPLGARIVAIADVYQALLSDRPYRKAYSKTEARDIIEAGSGTQFDPHVVEAFLKIS